MKVVNQIEEGVSFCSHFLLFLGLLTLISVALLMGAQALEAINLYTILRAPNLVYWSYVCLWGAVYMALVAMVSLVGSGWGRRKEPSWVGILSIVNTFLCVVVLVSLTTSYQANFKEAIERRLTICQSVYNWSESGGHMGPEGALQLERREQTIMADEATRMWDYLQQGYQCCGVHTGDEWKSFAPDGSSSRPKSCCLPQEVSHRLGFSLCPPDSSLVQRGGPQSGCLDRIRAPIMGVTLLLYLALSTSLFISLMILVGSCCGQIRATTDLRKKAEECRPYEFYQTDVDVYGGQVPVRTGRFYWNQQPTNNCNYSTLVN